MTLSPQKWLESGSFFEYKGHRLFLQSQFTGHQPLILLIHGFPTSSWDWHKMWPFLQTSYDLVAIDMLGFGFSDKPQGHHYSIMEQADIIEAMIRYYKIREIHVIAHDYGDTVAQELLARQHEQTTYRILSMTLLNGGLFPEMHRPRPVQKLLISPLGFLAVRLMNRRSFDKSFSEVFGKNTQPNKAELDACWQMIQYNNGKLNFHRLIRYMPERRKFRERWVGALQKTHIPLLLLNGPDDPVSGRHMTVHYSKMIPNPRIILLETIGHYPNLEAPEKCVQHIMDFFNDIAV